MMKPFLHSLLLLLVAGANAKKRNTDFIPCSDPCNGGDVNYEIVASVRTMPLLNYTYRGRTFSTQDSDSFMGPTMRVSPGQSLWIKLRNNLEPGDVGPHETTVEDYWKMLQHPGEKIKYQRYKTRVDSPEKLKVDAANMPHDFDATNIHLHGLDVEVHMFDPVNTHDAQAPHIAVHPGQCYCYKFQIPQHHPSGLYWYHPHLHGSTAVQLWGGMMGLLYVEGPLEKELANYGVTQSQEFVIWDPAFQYIANKPTHNLEVDEFLLGQTTLSKIHPFLINGQMSPNFSIGVGEILHLRVLCATIENENTFIVYPQGRENEHWDDAALPFWIIASDGVTYRQPLQKNIIVLSGGQREEILLKFDQAGEYVISQQGIQGMQFFDMRGHPHDQILATITVTDEGENALLPTVPISEMTFTPGFDESDTITAEEIDASETIVFSMGAMFDQVPFPQYYVNGYPFDPNRINFHAHPGESREYVLINANHNAHPFHIHVNRFQVKDMGSELSTKTYPVLESVLDFDPDVWRDTVMVPPNGRTKIWLRYGNYTGKTVFHCHFLAHEDTGMMATLFIGQKDLIFRFEEHFEVLKGIVMGVAFLTTIMLVYWMLKAASANEMDYTPVAMNELKSKTID